MKKVEICLFVVMYDNDLDVALWHCGDIGGIEFEAL